MLASLCIGLAETASAQTVTVADVEAVPGETVAFTMNLSDGKADTYTSLQFNVQFPATGFTTTGDYTIASAWKNASATVGDVDAAGLAIVPVSSAEAITGSDVENLLTVNFTVGSDVAVGDYDVTLSKITFGYGFTDKDVADDVTFQLHVVNAHTIVLDESSTTAPVAATGVNVRVLRTIKADEWSTICLPFGMTEVQCKAAFGDAVKLADFDGYDYDEEKDAISIKFTDVTSIEANHPYIIKVSGAVTEFTVDGVDIDPVESPTKAAVKRTKKQWSEMIGTYVANTPVGDEETEGWCLFLSDNKFWYSMGKTKMKAFRAYFDFYDVLSEVEESSARISMMFDETTGIGDLTPALSEGEGVYYNLKGQRVVAPSKGLYVVDGKKVVIK